MNGFGSFLKDVMDRYVEFLKAGGRYNDFTAAALRSFDRHCAAFSNESEGLSQYMADSWCSKRESETNLSCRARINPVINLLTYMKERGYTDIDIPEKPKWKRGSYIPHAFSKEEFIRFFKECDSIPLKGNSPDAKNRKITPPVLFRLLYSSGMRVFEIRFLKRNDVDLKTGIISIRKSKRNIEHFVVIHDSLIDSLRRYDEIISELYPDREYFFPGINDSPFLNAKWLCANFKKLWKRANGKDVIPYDLRHNYIIENINRWVNDDDFFSHFVYLSKSCGHTCLKSTKYYFSFVPAVSAIIDDINESSFNSLIPEVDYEDF